MADKATQAGHRVSHQYLQELAASGPKEWPRHAETIKGLAAATDTTEAAIVHAFARSFGLRVDPTSVAERIPPAVDMLPQGVQDAITTLVWNLTRELTETPAGREERPARDEPGGRGAVTVTPQELAQE